MPASAPTALLLHKARHRTAENSKEDAFVALVGLWVDGCSVSLQDGKSAHTPFG
jgi:hypothetical protein